MPKGKINPLWKDESIQELFMDLCRKSIKPSVNWKKFHRLDKKGIFKEFPLIMLSAQ